MAESIEDCPCCLTSNCGTGAMIAQLEAERARYREALGFYADRKSWLDVYGFPTHNTLVREDGGQRARAALKGDEHD